jgi:hypothetical protein
LLKLVHCEHCQKEYVYKLERSATGSGTSMLFLNNRGASARAAAQAQDKLRRSLEEGADLVPCPACGYYQAHMLPLARRGHRRWMLLTGAWLTLGLIPIALIAAAINDAARPPLLSWPVFVALLGPPALLGIGLMFGKLLLAAAYDPNHADEDTRKQFGQQRAMLREDFEKLVKAQNQAAAGEPADSGAAPYLAPFENPRPRDSRAPGQVARRRLWIAALVLAAALLVYLGIAFWIGETRKVYLVNGTGSPYVVSVAGQDVVLPARGAVPVRVPEGEVVVTLKDARPPLPPVLCRIETSFWTRPFSSPTFVINPDQSALIVTDETVYSATPLAKQPSKAVFHFGQPTYTFFGMNYEFQEFPHRIQVEGGRMVTKTRVGVVPALAEEIRFQFMLQNVPPPQQGEFCRRVLSLDPAATAFLYWLGAQLPPEQMLELVQARLDDLPPRIEWHRAYQSQMERAHPEQDLRPRYQQLVAKTNRRADAVYLLGRVERDWDKAQTLFREAAQADPASRYAMYALGYNALTAGHFDEAVRWLERAREGNPLWRFTYYEALRANGELDRLLTLLQEDAKVPGQELTAAYETSKTYVLQGNRQKAREALMHHARPGQDDVALERELDRLFACAKGDAAGYLKAAAEAGSNPSFEVTLLRGDLARAAAMADQPPQSAIINHALLYLAAVDAKRKELADKQWTTLLAQLSKAGREERRFGNVLAGREPLVPQHLERFIIDPKIKRVLLFVLAQRYPQQSTEILPLARELDYERDAVSLCLHKGAEK